MEKESNQLLSPSEFARHPDVKVHPSRITALKDKLEKKVFGKKWMVYVNDHNLSFFKNPHVNSKRRNDQ